eukprot:SAG22_NODE_18_length_32591_cov_38.043549_19_plen_201_part_00
MHASWHACIYTRRRPRARRAPRGARAGPGYRDIVVYYTRTGIYSIQYCIAIALQLYGSCIMIMGARAKRGRNNDDRRPEVPSWGSARGTCPPHLLTLLASDRACMPIDSERIGEVRAEVEATKADFHRRAQHVSIQPSVPAVCDICSKPYMEYTTSTGTCLDCKSKAMADEADRFLLHAQPARRGPLRRIRECYAICVVQ